MAFLCLLTLVVSSVVAAISSTLVFHEHRAHAPPGFTSHGRVSDSHMLTLRFGLASNNVAALQDKLLSISTPGSRDFRQWLSEDEVKTFMVPSSDTINAFNTFASANGLQTSVISPNGDWVSVTLPVSKANKLFGAVYTNFSHPDLPAPITRTLSISLPAELAGHVDVIHPSTAFTAPIARRAPSISRSAPKHKRDATAPVDCDTIDPENNITPACLQNLYNIPTTPATQGNNTLLVTGYVEEWAEVDDLQAFLAQFRPDLPPNQTFLTALLDGGTNPQGPGIAGFEATLDVQYAAGIATGVPLQFLSVGTFLSDFPTSVLDTTTFLASAAQLPTVVTSSYGLNEDFFGASLATKICDAFAGLSARGVSFLFSSGDGGVNGGHDNGDKCGLFIASFPSSCPWVTTVGSTIGFNPELAANFTGGGFSSIFPAPSYQTTAISNFLKTLPPSFPGNAKFNTTNRAFPDLSLQGVNFLINFRGEIEQALGTSASTPSVAGMVALINDRLIKEGKPVLGFLNPFLYANEGAFNDVVKGHNSGFECPASSVAFDAVPGWDPLSGLGTPNFPDLLAAALA
ncbi:family S53 protease-like protein [Favolaschia claudopus]|uniref:tripeptidyl-peptidase II n=1 Tax=Favolaschia claudopus TaxID=2862362 RepID=A0AAV9Z577_9AGAR